MPVPGNRPESREIASTAEVVETHTAILFFVGDRVFKVKKGVDLGFLDFRERSARRTACQDEVELNQRLSPDVYLGVADLIGPGGEPWESMVVMRRMPSERRLSKIVVAGSDRLPDDLRTLGRLMATFHQRCPTSPTIASYADPDAIRGLWRENVAVLRPDWTLLRSDVVRKELAGIPPHQAAPAAYGSGL